MWFKRKERNRRLGRTRVLDVKLRSSKVRAARVRMVGVAFGVCFGTVLGIYILWRAGEWTLDALVYENKSFAIQQIEVQTDGVIAPDELRRWSGVRIGQNLFALDLARVKRDLEMAATIQSVSIERVLPGTLRLRVTEREPVAQVNMPHPKVGGGIEFSTFQIDDNGYVMQPLDPRQRSVPSSEADNQLPMILGINAADLQPGRRIESPQVRAALQWIDAFESSPMTSVVDVKKIDVLSPEVLIVTTGQGSEITFGTDNFDQQLLRWQKIQEECARMNRTIAALNLAVSESTPLRFVEAAVTPPPVQKNVKPQRTRKRNV